MELTVVERDFNLWENPGANRVQVDLEADVVQFYPWFKFHFLLFQNHYQILPYPKTKETKI